MFTLMNHFKWSHERIYTKRIILQALYSRYENLSRKMYDVYDLLSTHLNERAYKTLFMAIKQIKTLGRFNNPIKSKCIFNKYM